MVKKDNIEGDWGQSKVIRSPAR